jgi:hypothetical protein
MPKDSGQFTPEAFDFGPRGSSSQRQMSLRTLCLVTTNWSEPSVSPPNTRHRSIANRLSRGIDSWPATTVPSMYLAWHLKTTSGLLRVPIKIGHGRAFQQMRAQPKVRKA